MAEVVQSDKVKDNSETKKKRVRAILDCTRKNTVSSKRTSPSQSFRSIPTNTTLDSALGRDRHDFGQCAR